MKKLQSIRVITSHYCLFVVFGTMGICFLDNGLLNKQGFFLIIGVSEKWAIGIKGSPQQDRRV